MAPSSEGKRPVDAKAAERDAHAAQNGPASPRFLWLACALLAVHAALLAFSARRHTPVSDEMAHLPAGIAAWRFGRLDLYRVNPPLVKMLAAAPVVLAAPETDWSRYDARPGLRSAWTVGRDFVRANGQGSLWYFTMARWACLPLSLLGGWVCWRWARQLYGEIAGLAALSLWCFSPNILAHAQLITPDAGAAALGLWGTYLFWLWLREPVWERALPAGIALGLMQLSKMTWIVAFGLWPLLWLVWMMSESPRAALRGIRIAQASRTRQALQLATVLLVGLYVLNAGYGFQGTFTRLADFEFVSGTLGGIEEWEIVNGEGDNRFHDSRLGSLPVPLPRDYLRGLDIQKRDFERGGWSYLRGEWRHGGWWYYYLYGLAVKVPLGTWLLALLAMGAPLILVRKGLRDSANRADSTMVAGSMSEGGPSCQLSASLSRRSTVRVSLRDKPPCNQRAAIASDVRAVSSPVCASTSWRDAVVLVAPAVVVLTLVSSQTGFNHHLRYVLPALPFLFVWISRVGRCLWWRNNKVFSLAAAAALVCSMAGSLSVYPHSLSFFNLAAGGPANGSAHLLHSNIDWGQDLLYLKEWLDDHPEAAPIRVACSGAAPTEIVGIDPRRPPKTVAPGWYAVSINILRGEQPHDKPSLTPRDGPYYDYFQHQQPVATAGYSICIYHITREEAKQVRREMGLPEVAE